MPRPYYVPSPSLVLLNSGYLMCIFTIKTARRGLERFRCRVRDIKTVRKFKVSEVKSYYYNKLMNYNIFLISNQSAEKYFDLID